MAAIAWVQKGGRLEVGRLFLARRHAAPGGMLVVTYIDEEKRLPSVSIVSRMKGEETFFKTGNVENALYNAGTDRQCLKSLLR